MSTNLLINENCFFTIDLIPFIETSYSKFSIFNSEMSFTGHRCVKSICYCEILNTCSSLSPENEHNKDRLPKCRRKLAFCLLQCLLTLDIELGFPWSHWFFKTKLNDKIIPANLIGDCYCNKSFLSSWGPSATQLCYIQIQGKKYHSIIKLDFSYISISLLHHY